VFQLCRFDTLRGDALDRLIDEGIDQRDVVAVVGFEVVKWTLSVGPLVPGC
jgi:hypothetical protein